MNQQQIAELVEKATSNDNQRPPIEIINVIVEQVNAKDQNAQVVTEQILRRLQMQQLRVIFFSLGLLDILMDRCSTPFHRQVAQQAFFKQLVAMLNNPKMNADIQKRIAFLIKKWADKFKSKQETLPTFTQVYEALLKRGVRFPDMPITASASSQGSQGGQAQPAASEPGNNKTDSKGGDEGSKQLPAKFQKLVNDMNLVKGNINFTNEIIDQLKPGEQSEALEDLYRTLTQLEPKLINMIGQIDDEGVMGMCLIVNDDLHKTFERYRAIKEGRMPEKFIPGESVGQTMLAPGHVYTRSESLDAPTSNSDSKPAPAKPAAADVDLFDLMGGSSAPQQQQPQQQMPQQPMPQMMGMQGQAPMMGQPMNPMMAQMQQAMAQRFATQQAQMQQQMPPQQEQPPSAEKPFDPDDVLGRLNAVMKNMQTNQQQQQQPPQKNMNQMGMQPGMGMGMQQPMANNFQTMQMGGGMNPFAAQSSGLTYQNPNHNVPQYSTNVNPFAQGGPSTESWQRDVNELGLNVKFEQKPKQQNDNVKEFQDLFAAAKGKQDWNTAAPKRTIDLSYNPGTLPAQAKPQPMMQEQPKPQAQSAFDQPPVMAAAPQQQPADIGFSFDAKPPSAIPEMDTTEKFGQLNLNAPISSEEEQKAQAAIDDILGGFDKPQAPVQVQEIDANKIFDFAGMDTNRTDALVSPANGQAQAAAMPMPPVDQSNAPAEAAPAQNADANDPLAGFM